MIPGRFTNEGCAEATPFLAAGKCPPIYNAVSELVGGRTLK
jgi:hypothetical protein